jgi:bacteriocin-like protein
MAPDEINNAKNSDELNDEQLNKVSGGQGISVPVKLKNAISVPVPDGRSIAQRDSPYETNDNLPS